MIITELAELALNPDVILQPTSRPDHGSRSLKPLPHLHLILHLITIKKTLGPFN